MSKFVYSVLGAGVIAAVVLAAGPSARAAEPTATGTTSGPAAGSNVVPGGAAAKNQSGDAHSAGMSSGAASAGAPGVAGKPGAESDPGRTPPPGARKPQQ
jgi:hypothetical protein